MDDSNHNRRITELGEERGSGLFFSKRSGLVHITYNQCVTSRNAQSAEIPVSDYRLQNTDRLQETVLIVKK